MTDGCLSSCQPGGRDSERGAADIIHPQVKAELDGSLFAAVFAADAGF